MQGCLVSRFRIQVSSRQLPNISPCLEGSTERSDGSLGRSLRNAAMVARDKATGDRQHHGNLPGRQYHLCFRLQCTDAYLGFRQSAT